MNDSIPVGTTKSIRECGHDEYWLQNQIAENPNSLQLGELLVISRERQQANGGRLDILLKDPDDDSMYEVEIMLGETDETHIIRTIEYWDNEKRRWPQRQHFAVLVAETINRRFFNVIQLLSHAVPIIAIQVNIVEADGNRLLHFSKILDTYEEPEDESTGSNEPYDDDFWQKKSAWTLDTAKCLIETIRSVYPDAKLNLVKNYIAVSDRKNNHMWLWERSGGKTNLEMWFSDTLISQAQKQLDESRIAYVRKKQTLRITVDKQMVQANAELLLSIAKLVKQSWEG